MDNPVVSVIIPVYNVEKYLDRCVQSVIGQTYKNLEILLVDDGSSDGCGAICDRYALADSRVVVIHKENGGLSDARNVGINVAKGQYLTFVDGDDYLALDCVECLYDNLQKYDADVSVISLVDPAHYKPTKTGQVLRTEIFEPETAVVEMLHAGKITVSACGKIYRRDSFQGIQFPHGKWYEDLATTYKIVLKADRIVWSSHVGYFYVVRSGSIMHSAFSEKWLDRIGILEEMEQTLPMENRQIAQAYAALSVMAMLTIVAQRPGIELIKEYGLWEQVKRYRLDVILNRDAPMRERMWSAVSYLGPNFLPIAMNGYYKLKKLISNII